VSWVIAFISACVAAGLRNAAEDDALPSRGGAARRAPDPVLLVPPLSPLTWFVIVFNLFLLAGYVVAAGGPGRLDKYRRIVSLDPGTANIVFLTLEASAYVQRQLPSQLGLAAGLIMLDMIYFLWIIAVGAEDGTLAKRLTVEAELPALRPARQNGIADGGGGAGDGGEAGSTGGGRSPARAAPTPAPMAAPAVAVPAVAKAAKRPVSMANSVETTMTEYALKAQALYPCAYDDRPLFFVEEKTTAEERTVNVCLAVAVTLAPARFLSDSASADDPNELTFEQVRRNGRGEPPHPPPPHSLLPSSPPVSKMFLLAQKNK
ncbi:MAG: hypothetical protein BJ554DRAFT_83, partial [Olpidium bornovanus]